MFRKSVKNLVKRGLMLSRVKILYTRITLTRFTTAYFFLALSVCLALTVLQTITFAHNSAALIILEPVHKIPDMGIVMIEDNKLLSCKTLPSQSRKECTTIMIYGPGSSSNVTGGQSSSRAVGLAQRTTAVADLSNQCILSLKWMDDLLHDAKREDLVNLAFNFWLFILALTTVVNESIPHLFAAFLGHVLGTGWAAYRFYSTCNLMHRYQDYIVPQACGGVDILKGWWDGRLQSAIPNLVINGITLIGYAYLSFRLFKVYANETFSRVGASPQIHRMYKVTLVFLVCLQLSGFFSLASTALWLDKICHDPIQHFAFHYKLYLAAFIITLVAQPPWLFLGWICVRRECRIRFGIFIAIAFLLLLVSTAMFFSPLYRYVFMTWAFFTTVSCTAYLLVLTTTVLSVLCRLNFGKGLAHYFQVTEALDGVDFTLVVFSKGEGIEKPLQSADSKTTYLDLPPLAYQNNANRSSGRFSIYSQRNTSPIQLFGAKPLMSDLGTVPQRLKSPTTRKRLSKLPPKRSTSLTRRSNASKAPSSPDFFVATPGAPTFPLPVVISSSAPRDTSELSPTQPPGIEVRRSPSRNSINSAEEIREKSVTPTIMTRGRGLPSNPRGAGWV
ncbi:hypothetical protein CPB83DRAFT_279871 [Crepidotus variabilis]|uniref:Uncharacterized protein n=1 Tax=Crepidotus variabilis TaxID=179855 RepID=A0A9P6JQP4_9AGAR|nr:hypothetical protein CPB83DRAFT_279871 [Crepidotus variabilis]